MKPDPIVEEIHEIRRGIMEECGNDSETYQKRLLQMQKGYGDRLVTRKPVRIPKRASA